MTMTIEEQAILETHFQFPGQNGFYRGKVRDVYYVADKLIVVASDRISAFDHVLPRPIPYKGQVLNQIAAYFLAATGHIAPNWLLATPDPNVSVGWRCAPFKVEMVVRGYLAGHAWREYRAGKRLISGAPMPEGLREGDPFPEPIVTPATKADEGHDEDISREEIIERGLASAEEYAMLERYSLALFQRGSQMARAQGLILVDTKYEFGKKDDQIMLIDEIHTPDSSRYYYLEGYEERRRQGAPQQQLSKEFVREWLMANGFQGLEGQRVPPMPDDFVWEASRRYIELYERLTGKAFDRTVAAGVKGRIEKNVRAWLSQNTR
jgi:phosphoribosylaminoimidazole-succinocarboxamide synthase